MATSPTGGATPPVLDLLLHERPPGHFTEADLDALPESARYEIVDGVLLVTPPPGVAHQRLVLDLAVQLRDACPAGVEVLPDIGYRMADDRLLVPDLTVARTADLGARGLDGTALLVVEVRSPSTRHYDAAFKRAVYAEAGVPSYWLADPDAPSLTVLELHAGDYRDAARLDGVGELALTRPFPVTIRLG